MQEQRLSASLGKYEQLVNTAIKEAEQADALRRIWARDASLWKSEPEHQRIIENALGWLTVADEMLETAGDLSAFADDVAGAMGFRQVMVCGMGGSSLCPEVLRQTFAHQSGHPELLVLDSTDPDVIVALGRYIEIDKCLFIIASKSGTTTEPLMFHKYWHDQVRRHKQNPGENFIAITDPGTALVKMAKDDGFRRVFSNQPDIGGRYSALSYFGMVPAALMGIDIRRFLQRASAAAQACGPEVPSAENQAVRLGAIMAECAKHGRDKLTLVADQKLAALGLWIEQLVAESTGKEGKGIIPISGEPLNRPSLYGDDRLFVSIALGNPEKQTAAALRDLEAAGHPVVYLTLADLYDLGGHFFFWELATAFAGWRLGINPFDQPNVQESKDATKELLEGFKREGKLREQTIVAQGDGLTIYADERTAISLPRTSVVAALRAHLLRARTGDYIALLDYVEETPEIEASIQDIRLYLRAVTSCATTTGYGPRFLHSTGQLHKGGPNTGVFIQNTANDATDLPIPGEPYSFSILKQAQALGDFRSLAAHERRVIRVHLGSDVPAGLKRLREMIIEAMKE
ncbi:MAG TPA: bifunctional transaldolase/phosoglucose isomerase [Pyrinomonadaceae bacterium]|nr:bifunctional transaldolase/phosoglucose isomerase [Pyrinomonadaceae bacterium]